MTTATILLATLPASVLLAELAGYAIHRLLHSENLPFLSRPHMWHHLKDYAPGQNQRSARYRDSAAQRFALFGLGTEWLLPLLVVSLAWSGLGLLLGLYLWVNLLSVLIGQIWGALMFGFMHARFHLSETWFVRHPLVRTWFLRIRRLHDIHHHRLTDDGRMAFNLGICFFWFDRLFGSYRMATGPRNQRGLQRSREIFAEMQGSLGPKTT